MASKPLPLEGERPQLCAVCLAAPATGRLDWGDLTNYKRGVEACAECIRKRSDPRNDGKAIGACT